MPRVQVHSNSKLSADKLHEVIQALPVIISSHLSTLSSPLSPSDVSIWDCSTSNHSRPSHDLEVVIDFTSCVERMRIFFIAKERIAVAVKALLPPGISAYVWLQPKFEAEFIDIST